ncbi:MAG: hypothetical protein QGH07_08225, partial [Alphaproteobacteria bacterium]|nr:hypothetical protein [Alphaproteobacteria bacterium]
LFDIFTPILAAIGLYKGWIKPPTRKFCLTFALICSLIIVHSAVVYAASDIVTSWHLIKGTIKLLVLVILFASLLLIFRETEYRKPGRPLLLGYLAITIPAIVLLHIYEPFFISRTNQAFIFVGLLFVMATDTEWLVERSLRYALAAVGLVIAGACFYIHSKVPAAIALVFVIWFLALPGFRKSKLGRFASGAGISLAILFTVLGSYLVIFETSLLPNIDTLQRSAGVRIKLWDTAWTTTLTEFPFGAGAGQMSSVLLQNDWAVRESHLQVHNSFLNLGAELGVLGFAFALGGLWIIGRGARKWPIALEPLFVLFALLPLLIHDGHSIRIWVLITALSFAQALTPTANAQNKS